MSSDIALPEESVRRFAGTEAEKDRAEKVMCEDVDAVDITQEEAHAVHTVDGVSWTQDEERAIVRKMDWNIVPLVWALFMQVGGDPLLPLRARTDLVAFAPGSLSSTDPVRSSRWCTLDLRDSHCPFLHRHWQYAAPASISARTRAQLSDFLHFPAQMQIPRACQSIST